LRAAEDLSGMLGTLGEVDIEFLRIIVLWILVAIETILDCGGSCGGCLGAVAYNENDSIVLPVTTLWSGGL
jgi:hypothetical protein